MKTIIIFFATMLTPSMYLFSQYIPPSEGTRYSIPLEIDSSSQTFVMGFYPGKKSKDNYIVNVSQYDYVGNGFEGWTNMIFYNTKNRFVTKLFPENRFIYIHPLTTAYTGIASHQNQNISTIFSKFILLSVKTDDYNQDGIIDEADPVSLYICTNTGDKVVQVNPKNTNVISWTLSQDEKIIIAKLERDENSDKKFKNENELLYQINLDDDFTKISVFPMPVNDH